MSDLKDFAILEAIRNGSDKILLKLYNEYRDQFIGWALTNHELTIEEAKDIFQDSIIAFHENIRTGKVSSLDSSVKTYLFGIGKNRIRDHFKMKEVRMRHADNLVQLYSEPSSTEQKEDLIEEIKLVILTMGAKCKNVLQLFYIRGFDMESIANELGFKNANVAKKTKYECMKSLESKVKLIMK